jgi:DNA-binding CsgD family transcriptional regulator
MFASQLILRNPGLSSAPAIKLVEGTTVVGRDATCSIVLTDPSISRFHAELSVNGAQITVRDLKSRNGTYVDGERVQTADLRAGQQLHFGCVMFDVRMTGVNGSELDAELETQSVSDVFESSPVEIDQLRLSAAERRVFDLILYGHAEKEMARRLQISRHTVHCHVRRIYQVLDVRSRAELLAQFVRRPNGSQEKPPPRP